MMKIEIKAIMAILSFLFGINVIPGICDRKKQRLWKRRSIVTRPYLGANINAKKEETQTNFVGLYVCRKFFPLRKTAEKAEL